MPYHTSIIINSVHQTVMARDKLLLWFGSSFGGGWLHGRLHCLDELDDEEKAADKRTKVHRVGRPLGTKSSAFISMHSLCK